MPGSRLTAEFEVSHDDVRDTRHELGLRVRVPLSGGSSVRSLASLTGQERRMLDGIERDTDIVTARSKAEGVEDNITGTDFDRVAYVNGGSLGTVSAANGNNTLVIVNGTVDAGTQTIQSNQTIQGGGSTIAVRGRRSGTVIPFTAPGARPTVINSGGGHVITLTGEGNIHLAGLLVDGNNNGGHGIQGGSNKTNIAITQNTIQNSDDHGINFGNNNGVIFIDGNNITGSENNGIDFNNNNSSIVITNNNIVNARDHGILFASRNSNITISDNTISSDRDQGIQFASNNSNVTIANNVITSDDAEGILFTNRNTNITVSDNTITSDETGIQFNNNNSNIAISRNTITAISDEAIEFNNRNIGIVISANTLRSIGSDIIDIDDRNSGLITNNVLLQSGGGSEGIDFEDRNTFTITGNTFNGIGNNAIELDGNNTLTISSNLFNSPNAPGDVLLQVNGGGNALSGSGNISTVPITCNSGTFTGTVSFVNGTVLQDGVPPCN